MKTRQHNMGRLRLVLASGIIAYAGSVEAKKPAKPPPEPPPEPPPAAPYNLVMLGDPGSYSYAVDINESGLVVSAVDAVDYREAALVIPEMDEGKLVWRKDADSDGCNDLLIDLGTAAGADPDSSYPCNINDHGVILGSAEHSVADQVPKKFAWILAPQLIDNQLSWTDLDAGGVNGMMIPLPVVSNLEDPYLEVLPQRINNHGEVAVVVQCIDGETSEGWQRGFLLVPDRYEVASDGTVTIEYPEADLDGDGLNDYLIDLGSGVRIHDGATSPLNAIVINDQGDVAGKVWNDKFYEANGEQPFALRPRTDENGSLVWNEDQNGDGLNDLVTYLPLPEEVVELTPSWGSSIASISDMNENGTIVGSVFYIVRRMVANKAAVWQMDWEAGTVSYTEFGPLVRDYLVTGASSVNAAGQVVGGSVKQLKFPDVLRKGWLWDQGEMIALENLVPEDTGLADISYYAVGINDSSMIVGSLQAVSEGEWTAFIAIPVEQP